MKTVIETSGNIFKAAAVAAQLGWPLIHRCTTYKLIEVYYGCDEKVAS